MENDMARHGIAYLAIVFLMASIYPCSPGEAETRGVIELFTSQGCSSCPPADHVLGELARDPSLVAISVPVDYWDYLGWKDTLASPRHSARQRGYASMRGDRNVYTPQAVINGVIHVVGSDKSGIERALVQSRRNSAILSLPVSLSTANGKLTVAVPAGKNDSAPAEVWLCPLAKATPVAIGRGENRGSTVTYYNVVRRWIKLGEWNGTAHTFTLPASELSAGDIDAVAVLVQSGSVEKPGTMMGAAITPLR
jgi:hypothetical protein